MDYWYIVRIFAPIARKGRGKSAQTIERQNEFLQVKAPNGVDGGTKMSGHQPSWKRASGTAAALLALSLAWAPAPAQAEISNVSGVDYWYLSGGDEAVKVPEEGEGQQEQAAPSNDIDVLSVTGNEGDMVYFDVLKGDEVVASHLAYELQGAQQDANGDYVGILSMDIDSFDPASAYTVRVYSDRSETNALYEGQITPVYGLFCKDANDAGEQALIMLRTLASGEDRPFTMPEVLKYQGGAYQKNGEVDGVTRYVLSDSIPQQITGHVTYYALGDSKTQLKQDEFTITKDDPSQMVHIDTLFEANGAYYRALNLTDYVTAKYPGVTEFSIMCVPVTGDWGDEAAPYEAQFRYVDAATYDASRPEDAENLRDRDSSLSGLLDKLVVNKDYTYTPPAYIYIKDGETIEAWELDKDQAQLQDGSIVLAPEKDAADKTIDIAYKRVPAEDAKWHARFIDADTKQLIDVSQVEGLGANPVTLGLDETLQAPGRITVAGKTMIRVPGSQETYSYNADESAVPVVNIYYYDQANEGEAYTDSYDVTVNYVNIANGARLRTETYPITPDFITQRRYQEITPAESFAQGGVSYVRINGQSAVIRHGYFDYDTAADGGKAKTYTVYYRDVNDDLHAQTTITTVTTVYDTVVTDLGTTDLGTTVVAGGGTTTTGTATLTGGTGTGTAAGTATGGTATLTDNGGINVISTGNESTIVRDDGTSVTTERIEEDANPLAAPTDGQGEDATQTDGTTNPVSETFFGAPIGAVLGGAGAAVAAALAYLFLKGKKDEEDADE